MGTCQAEISRLRHGRKLVQERQRRRRHEALQLRRHSKIRLTVQRALPAVGVIQQRPVKTGLQPRLEQPSAHVQHIARLHFLTQHINLIH